MDLLVANKANPNLTQQMTLEVFGMNGGKDEWDVLDNSESETWNERINSLTQSTAPTKKSQQDLINNAASAAGIIVGNSQVLSEAGKLEAVAVVNSQAQQQLNGLVVDSGEGAGNGDDLQAQLLANAGKGDVQTLTLDQLNGPSNNFTGNSQMHGDGSPEQAQRIRESEQAKQPAQVPAGNVAPSTPVADAAKSAPKSRAKRSDSGKPKAAKPAASTTQPQAEVPAPTDTTQTNANGFSDPKPE